MKKTVALGLTLAALASPISPIRYTPIMAAEASQKVKILTLDHAIQGGMNMEEKMGVIDKQLNSANRTLKATDDISSQTYQTTKINRDALLQQVDFVKDTVEYKVTTQYQNILNTQKEIELYEKKIELAKENLRIVKVRANKGLATALDITKAQTSIIEAQASLEKAKANLIDQKKQFVKLTNINIDNYTEIDNPFEFEPLNYAGGANALITSNVDFYLRSQDELASYKENNILKIAQENSGGLAPSMLVVSGVAADAANTAYQANQSRLSLTNGLNTCYANLVSMQESLKTLEESKKDIEHTYEMNKVRYKLGQLTDYQLKQSECAVYEIDFNYQQLLTNYLQTKMYFEKPWVK